MEHELTTQNQPRTDALIYFHNLLYHESDIFQIPKKVIEGIQETGTESLIETRTFTSVLSHFLATLKQFKGQASQIDALIWEEVELYKAKKILSSLSSNSIIPSILFKDRKGTKVLATSDNLGFLCSCYGILVEYEELTDTILIDSAKPNELTKLRLEDLLALNSLPLSLLNRLHLVSLQARKNPIKDWIDSKPYNGISQIGRLGLTNTEQKILSLFVKQVLKAIDSGGLLEYVFLGKGFQELFPDLDSSGLWKQVSFLELGLSQQTTHKVTRMFLGRNMEVTRRQNLVGEFTLKQVLASEYKILPIQSILDKLAQVNDLQQFWAEARQAKSSPLSKKEIAEYMIDKQVKGLREVGRCSMVNLSLEELGRLWGCEDYLDELKDSLAWDGRVCINSKFGLPSKGF